MSFNLFNLFKKKDNMNTYIVSVYTPTVDSMKLQMNLRCKLGRDPEDRLLYLSDIETNGKTFKELFPGENRIQFNKEEIPQLELNLKDLLEKKKNANKKAIENYLNIDKQIHAISFLLSKYKEERGAFVFTNDKGINCVTYLRKSTGLHPLNYNVNSNNVFQPTETDSRDAFLSWKGKYEALQDKKDKGIKTLITIFGIFVAGIIIIGLGYGSYKVNTYNQRADVALMEQKYICQQVYEEGIAKMIATNQQTADMLQDTVGSINISTGGLGFVDGIVHGVTTTTDILK